MRFIYWLRRRAALQRFYIPGIDLSLKYEPEERLWYAEDCSRQGAFHVGRTLNDAIGGLVLCVEHYDDVFPPCACGTPITACPTCGEDRCLTCDPIGSHAECDRGST